MSGCSDQEYSTFCEHFKKVTNKENIENRGWIVHKIRNAFLDLYTKRKWKRIEKLIEASNPKEFNEMIEIAMDYFANNLEASKSFESPEDYQNLVEYTFAVMEKDISCK